MSSIKNILETLKINQEIARKFFEIESSILSILDFKDLFEELLSEIKEKFGVPYVWFSVIDKSEISDLIHTLTASEILKDRLNLVERNSFLSLIADNTKPILANEDLKPFYKLLPQKQKYLVRSLAVAPLTLDGEIIGSLNYADHSELRYQSDMEVDLLEQLAVKVSLCLSNVMAHEQLKVLAYKDPLTGLLNRRVMDDALKREFKRTERHATALSLIFIDLDDLKTVNDRYGHNIGDHLLKYIATHLKDMSRESDIIARIGGDEFVIILPGTSSKEAHNFMKRLQKFLKKNPLNVSEISIPASISFGIATVKDKTINDAESLLKKADTMLYQAKKLKWKHNAIKSAVEPIEQDQEDASQG